MKRNFYYPSSDGKTTIHASEWTPDGEPKAILQIIHGMVEYAARYDRFAEFLTVNGICVVAIDLLGHGESVVSDEKHGYFKVPNGIECVIDDIHALRTQTEAKYPGVPYFILGHSMGSFLVRQYMALHGEGIRGFIVMGTGVQPSATLFAAKLICRVTALFKGWEHRSSFIDSLAFSSYNKSFEPARTKRDWLTRDEAIVDRYVTDPWCSFVFTVNGFYEMFRAITFVQDRTKIAQTPHSTHILITSGEKDAVGNFGKAVDAVAKLYTSLGYEHVTTKTYPDARHEILNELNYAEVYDNILGWITARI